MIKEWIKKNEILYRSLIEVREWLIWHLTYLSPTWVSQIRYKQAFKKKLNLRHPQEFNEKLMWLKLNTYYKNPLIIQCADKVQVREYVKDCGCEELLIDCFGVYKNEEEIPWGDLPQQFVLKCNHGSGYNIVCNDKNKLNIREAKVKLKAWLKKNYALAYAEMQYAYIKPLIICEKYLQPNSGLLPDDYKVYCFHGKAVCILVCKERESGHCKCYMLDREWKFLDWIKDVSQEVVEKIERPSSLEKLLLSAEKLASGFPFVRVDFYVINDSVFFGEMTFTPHACTDVDYTELGNREMSKLLNVRNQK